MRRLSAPLTLQPTKVIISALTVHNDGNGYEANSTKSTRSTKQAQIVRRIGNLQEVFNENRQIIQSAAKISDLPRLVVH